MDTIEFSAEAFKTRPNAIIEDLLRKLPGIQVNNNGTIFIQGKKVNKILINGGEFFGANFRIATKNLDAEIVDKIQVYDDREDDPDNLLPDSKITKVINIKLKKTYKKSSFGKATAGIGTGGHYQASGIGNIFRDTLQVSVLGYANNINQSAFSEDELSTAGGFKRSGTNEDLNFQGANFGVERAASAGFNINDDWSKKIKANLMYFYRDIYDYNEALKYSQQYLNGKTQVSGTSAVETGEQRTHVIGNLINWSIDSASYFRYRSKINVTNNLFTAHTIANQTDTLNQPINNSLNDGTRPETNFSYNHTLNFYKKFHNLNESLNITNIVKLNPSSSNKYNISNTTVYSPLLVRDTVDQDIVNKSIENYYHFFVTYRLNLTKKIAWDLSAGVTFDNNNVQIGAYNFNVLTNNYDIRLFDQSNRIQRNSTSLNLRPGITWKITKGVRLTANVMGRLRNEWNYFESGQKDLNRRYYFLMPDIEFSTKK